MQSDIEADRRVDAGTHLELASAGNMVGVAVRVEAINEPQAQVLA